MTEPTTEPMKCANGCGGSIFQLPSGLWSHWDGNQRCKIFAKPPTGIKGEDAKPDERDCACGNVVMGNLDEQRIGASTHNRQTCTVAAPMVFERPSLPTSREWLEEDENQSGAPYCGLMNNDWGCTRRHFVGRHVAGAGKNIVCGRWYTDGPFVEAK